LSSFPDGLQDLSVPADKCSGEETGALRSLAEPPTKEHFMEVSSINQTAPVAPAAVSGSTDQASQNREIVQAVKAVNSAELYGPNQELTYQQDAASKRMVVRVVDSATKQVIVQIPPEYVLALAGDLGKT
jgi:uncharacterized FlaG/YvyC family protein